MALVGAPVVPQSPPGAVSASLHCYTFQFRLGVGVGLPGKNTETVYC